jgi:hypothetical protein
MIDVSQFRIRLPIVRRMIFVSYYFSFYDVSIQRMDKKNTFLFWEFMVICSVVGRRKSSAQSHY